MAFFSSGRQPLGSSNKKLGNDTGRNLPDEWVAVDWLRREAVRFDHGLKIASNGSTAWSHDWFSGGALVGEYEHPKMFNRLVNILFNLKIFFLKTIPQLTFSHTDPWVWTVGLWFSPHQLPWLLTFGLGPALRGSGALISARPCAVRFGSGWGGDLPLCPHWNE